MEKRFYYILEVQYLGFRYHGWQKQPNVITVQEMVLKTLKWVMPTSSNKVLASGRTDAMVSVNHTFIEFFTTEEIEDLALFLRAYNANLPADIRALTIKQTDRLFNIIQSDKIKEYRYYFAHGEKFHPYAAAMMCNVLEILDIELIIKAAKEFEGKHDFYSYTFRPTQNTHTEGEILSCVLEENTELTASFFPEKSYVLKIKGKGFKRNQIRLMVGMLFKLGQGQVSWEEFMYTLDGANKIKLSYIAPASGLHLFNVEMI